MADDRRHFDVVVVGAGLAGLTLTRHLLLYTDKTVLLLDKRKDPPRESPQKYGESLVQFAGYYFAKVLDLEEYLLINQYLKYNLRFYWPTEGLENRGFEDCSQSYIRQISNIETFQLDRNRFEEHLLETSRQNERCEFRGGVRNLSVEVSETGGLHQVRFEGAEIECRWVVDASGRAQFLKRQLALAEPSPIRHNATFFWVEGLVDIEKMTGRSHKEVIFDPNRRRTGHLPMFLATNHFCAEGQWFWVIPLHHKTSLGLVYDPSVVNSDEVSDARKVIAYACRKWPMLARDLPQRKIVDEGRRLIDYAHGCRQTISPQRWALVGEAGRFSDPLYSPGSDLISLYNQLIVDAIQVDDDAALEERCALAEVIQRVMYEAYLPTYAQTYDCLGDQEAFTLKYTWELTVYFSFYVFPMINNLLTNVEFMPPFLRRFAVLGSLNGTVQRMLSAFFQWKKQQPVRRESAPRFVDFMDMMPLRGAERLFYEVGLDPQSALAVADRQLERLQEFALYILTHVYASVLGIPEALTNAPFISSLTLRDAEFDPGLMRTRYEQYAGSTELYQWTLDPFVLKSFIQPRSVEAASART